MKVLVTGAAGFIGRHVLSALREDGYEAVAFDIKPVAERWESVRGDLTNLEDLLKATRGIDAVCHLGAIGDVYAAFDNPPLAAACNVTGTANLMEACRRNEVAKVIYAST